ncbi:MAG TPA: tRNA (guanine(46)-N(7))-methyltransferase TrmB [Micropepsaceae bacterium]|jgi:tRNA (guanine-N7-)-methyltransferase
MTDNTHSRKLYGRRKGPALSAHQTGLLARLLPRLAFAPTAGRAADDYFSAPVQDVWLEIGFGAGEHLAWQAQSNPDIGIIGVEPYVAGMAKLLAKLAPLCGEDGPDQRAVNIRLYNEDARDVIAALPDASLGRVFLLFPDPWPKTRHHKRRFVQMEMLDRLARVMKPGAEFRFATDDPGYRVWALERLSAHPAFAWLAEDSIDWKTRPADWPQTRYEAKAIHAGRACCYLRFARL